MALSGSKTRTNQSREVDRHSEPERERTADELDAKVIEEQIGPGLRSMYANILEEDLPKDLLAIVDAMAAKEDAPKVASKNPPEDPKADEGDGNA